MVAAAAEAVAGALQYLGAGTTAAARFASLQVSPVLGMSAASSWPVAPGPGRAPAAATTAAPQLRCALAPPRRGYAARGPGWAGGLFQT